MSERQLPKNENILLSAFREMATQGLADPAELVAEYERYFRTTVAVPPTQQKVFERFSLVDPTIRMTIRSNTASV